MELLRESMKDRDGERATRAGSLRARCQEVVPERSSLRGMGQQDSGEPRLPDGRPASSVFTAMARGHLSGDGLDVSRSP